MFCLFINFTTRLPKLPKQILGDYKQQIMKRTLKKVQQPASKKAKYNRKICNLKNCTRTVSENRYDIASKQCCAYCSVDGNEHEWECNQRQYGMNI